HCLGDRHGPRQAARGGQRQDHPRGGQARQRRPCASRKLSTLVQERAIYIDRDQPICHHDACNSLHPLLIRHTTRPCLHGVPPPPPPARGRLYPIARDRPAARRPAPPSRRSALHPLAPATAQKSRPATLLSADAPLPPPRRSAPPLHCRGTRD